MRALRNCRARPRRHRYRGWQHYQRSSAHNYDRAGSAKLASGFMRRDFGGAVGDDICVTGTLGDAALGWRLLAGKPQRSRSRTHEYEKKIASRKSFLSSAFPFPPRRRGSTPAARALQRFRPVPGRYRFSATALCRTLGHILERSSVGAEIDASRIPDFLPHIGRIVGDDLSLALGWRRRLRIALFASAPGIARLN